MTRFRLASVVVLGLACGAGLARAQEASATDAVWSEDVAASLQKAAAEKKDVLMDFNGSDWCPPCMALRSQVLDQGVFQKEAAVNFIFVDLDFPHHKPQSEEIKEQNQEWAKKVGVTSFPTLLLVDAQGRPFALQSGFGGADVPSYLKWLDKSRQARIVRDEKFAAAGKASGAEKARLLDEGLQGLEDGVVLKFYGPEVTQIEQLDAQGTIKARYAKMRAAAAAVEAFDRRMKGILKEAKTDPDGTIKQLQALAAEESLPKGLKQQALLVASRVCQLELKDSARAEPLFDAAIAVDPDSEMGRKLKENKGRFYPKPGTEAPVVPGTN